MAPEYGKRITPNLRWDCQKIGLSIEYLEGFSEQPLIVFDHAIYTEVPFHLSSIVSSHLFSQFWGIGQDVDLLGKGIYIAHGAKEAAVLVIKKFRDRGAIGCNNGKATCHCLYHRQT